MTFTKRLFCLPSKTILNWVFFYIWVVYLELNLRLLKFDSDIASVGFVKKNNLIKETLILKLKTCQVFCTYRV